MEKIKGVMLYIQESKMSYLQDWIDAFYVSPFFNLNFLEIKKTEKKEIIKSIDKLTSENFLILHHSVLRTPHNINIFKKYIPLIQNRKCKLLAFIGDEINIHNAPLKEKISVLKAIEPELIASQLLYEAAKYLYDGISSKIIEMPHALNEDVFKPYVDFDRREFDIAAISVPYPIYLGDNDREMLFDYFEAHSKKLNLKVNIKKTDSPLSKFRLDRNEWVKFLNNTKGTISTEAGSFYIDKDNSIINEVREVIKSNIHDINVINSTGTLKTLYDKIPIPINLKIKLKSILLSLSNRFKTESDIYFDNSYFPLIYEKVFKDRPLPSYYAKAISSRHFDAIGTKTLQILIEGKYNNILIPDEHYISLKRDFSNIEEVIEKFKDKSYCIKIVNQAYEYIISKHTYKHRLEKLYNLLTN